MAQAPCSRNVRLQDYRQRATENYDVAHKKDPPRILPSGGLGAFGEETACLVDYVIADFVMHVIAHGIALTVVEGHVVANVVMHIVVANLVMDAVFFFIPVFIDVFAFFEFMFLIEVVMFLIKVFVTFEAVTIVIFVVAYAIAIVATAFIVIVKVEPVACVAMIRSVHFRNDVCNVANVVDDVHRDVEIIQAVSTGGGRQQCKARQYESY